MTNTVIVSELDKQILAVIRSNVVSFMKHCSAAYAKSPGILLDIAPQDHEGARPFFPSLNFSQLNRKRLSLHGITLLTRKKSCHEGEQPYDYRVYPVCLRISSPKTT